MESSRLLALLGAAVMLLWGVNGQEEGELQPRAVDLYSTMEDTSHEKELVGPAALGVGGWVGAGGGDASLAPQQRFAFVPGSAGKLGSSREQSRALAWKVGAGEGDASLPRWSMAAPSPGVSTHPAHAPPPSLAWIARGLDGVSCVFADRGAAGGLGEAEKQKTPALREEVWPSPHV
ncbi:cocaine- and amphetamine-regulated transcript protein [Tiliqua scincoides]|uniref:cocaine- and amphetamine-regulated transcript protein n=1 Tax=Tiliqua scincoides TaxID=71010 RepID=UPI00346236ED